MKRERDEHFRIHWLRDLLCGILIGAGAILPGVSGGVLAVVFDIYRPFMELLTHPRQAIPKYWRWFLPIGLGCVIGFLGFAKGIAAAIDVSSTVTTWLFVGLIVGTVPALFREAGREGRGTGAWVSLAVCALAIFASLFYVGRVIHVTVEPSFLWYNFCGVLFGMSLVIPGLTSCLRACSLLYSGKYSGNSGLGPTKAMSPFNTFNSCGNSSSEVERTNRPTLVNRSASGNNLPSPSRSSVIDLNLITLNSFPSFPGRSCVKNTPAPLLAKCNHTAITANTGHITNNTHDTMTKSSKRLKQCLYI